MDEQAKTHEPGYQSVAELMESTVTPENVKDIARERHIALRNEIGRTTGAIELAYRRGVQVGFEDSQAPAMRKLLERVVKVAHVDESEMDEAAVKESIDVIRDIETLLGEKGT